MNSCECAGCLKLDALRYRGADISEELLKEAGQAHNKAVNNSPSIEMLPLLQALELHESRQLKDRMTIMNNRIKQLEERMMKMFQLHSERMDAMYSLIRQVLPEVN